MRKNRGLCDPALKCGITFIGCVLALSSQGQQLKWVKHYASPTTPVTGFRLTTDASGNI